MYIIDHVSLYIYIYMYIYLFIYLFIYIYTHVLWQAAWLPSCPAPRLPGWHYNKEKTNKQKQETTHGSFPIGLVSNWAGF